MTEEEKKKKVKLIDSFPLKATGSGFVDKATGMLGNVPKCYLCIFQVGDKYVIQFYTEDKPYYFLKANMQLFEQYGAFSEQRHIESEIGVYIYDILKMGVLREDKRKLLKSNRISDKGWECLLGLFTEYGLFD